MTSTILEDLNITTNQINFASQILLVGIVVLELPSNLLMQKVGTFFSNRCPKTCLAYNLWSLVRPLSSPFFANCMLEPDCNVPGLHYQLLRTHGHKVSPRTL